MFLDFEQIFVNGGSTDWSADILVNIVDARLKLVPQTNKGLGVPRNDGIAPACGAWLALFETENAWFQCRVGKLVGIASDCPQPGVINITWREAVGANLSVDLYSANSIGGDPTLSDASSR